VAHARVRTRGGDGVIRPYGGPGRYSSYFQLGLRSRRLRAYGIRSGSSLHVGVALTGWKKGWAPGLSALDPRSITPRTHVRRPRGVEPFLTPSAAPHRQCSPGAVERLCTSDYAKCTCAQTHRHASAIAACCGCVRWRVASVPCAGACDERAWHGPKTHDPRVTGTTVSGRSIRPRARSSKRSAR
jgi:hypothetical protein